jgi:hypothetical protein
MGTYSDSVGVVEGKLAARHVTAGATHTRRSVAGELVGDFRRSGTSFIVSSGLVRRSPLTHKAARSSHPCGWRPEKSAFARRHTHAR